MSLVFAIESLETVWDEWLELSTNHWKETEFERMGVKLNPLFENYNNYAKNGWFVMFTAREGNKLAGYAGIYIVPSMHTQRLIATEDFWYLSPEYRKGRNAINLCKFVEAEMKRRKVEQFDMSAKLGSPAGRILEYLGYCMVSCNYSKNLMTGTDSATRQEPKKEPIIVESIYVQASSPSST